jgi:hypothetical protein
VAERAADGLLALERNWEGPLAGNGGVDEALALWEQIDADAPELAGNWRWQLHLMRAYYDAYTRRRLVYETGLESDALTHLASAVAVGSADAMSRAEAALARATTANCCPAWRARIEALCDALFESIRLQTSLERHSASGAERGAVLGGDSRWRRRAGAARQARRPGGVVPSGQGELLRRCRRRRRVAASRVGRCVAALHVGRRSEPQAPLVADEPPLAGCHRLYQSGSGRQLCRPAQCHQADRARGRPFADRR